MRDPVLLPSSKTTIDRSTIKAHLLSDPTDPFNRAPLSIDDVVPSVYLSFSLTELQIYCWAADDELKKKIVDWIAEQRGKGKALDAPKAVESMDVDDSAMI